MQSALEAALATERLDDVAAEMHLVTLTYCPLFLRTETERQTGEYISSG